MLIIHRQDHSITKQDLERFQELQYRNYYCTQCDTFPTIDEMKITKRSIAHVVDPEFSW